MRHYPTLIVASCVRRSWYWLYQRVL